MPLRFAALVLFSWPTLLAMEPTTKPVSTPATVRIALAGDSTVTKGAGWGVGFADHLQGDIKVMNFSQGGRSSRSFLNEGHWKKLLDSKPDYILIQFGHNDQPGKGPERETDPATTYAEFLGRYISDAQALGATPILVTSIERRRWKDGKIDPTLTPYADAVRKLAAEKNVPLIDMNARTIELYERLGVDGCNTLSPMDPKDKTKIDNTHLNAKGSAVIGTIVAQELKKAVPALAKFVK